MFIASFPWFHVFDSGSKGNGYGFLLVEFYSESSFLLVCLLGLFSVPPFLRDISRAFMPPPYSPDEKRNMSHRYFVLLRSLCKSLRLYSFVMAAHRKDNITLRFHPFQFSVLGYNVAAIAGFYF